MIEQTDHMKEVARWLDGNVVVYPTPQAVKLSGFSVNWNEISGKFYVTLDETPIALPFGFSLEQSGWVNYHPPMFTSPLGAPASYYAVDLTDDTAKTLTKALRSIFPRLKPLGIDTASGAFIGQRTPVVERINDQEVFDQARELISRCGFCITVES